MKILITSDIHGDINKLALLHEIESFDLHLDAGDSNIHADDLRRMGIISVKGNTDFFSQLPPIRVIENELGKIIIVHGHNQSVKSGFELLVTIAENLRANYMIYGHTHNELVQTVNNITYINPGSLKYGKTYVVIQNNEIEIRKLTYGK
ncbi:MAG: metallophosphoesterase family protein [Acholeplasmataceae bacterium]|jgi:putative phosphoesterase